MDEITKLHIEGIKEDLTRLEQRLDKMAKVFTLILAGFVFPLLTGAILLGLQALLEK